jgi:hypothetical protein
MTVRHHNPHEFLHDGRVTAVAGGLMAMIVVAAGIVAVLGGLMWLGLAVMTALVG